MDDSVYSLEDAKKAALRDYPEFAHTLIPAMRVDWKFVPAGVLCRDFRGFRLWDDYWADAVSIRSASDAYGLRIDPAGMRVWSRTGTLTQVMRALLELPPPHDPRAPRLAIGYAPALILPSRGR